MGDTNKYDLLVSIIPTITVALISYYSLRISSHRERQNKMQDLRMNKLENCYTRLISIDSKIKKYQKELINKKSVVLEKKDYLEILLDVEKIKVESILYLGIPNSRRYISKAIKALDLLKKCKTKEEFDTIYDDGEYEKIDDEEYITLNKSTYDKIFDNYRDAMEEIENRIVVKSNNILETRNKKKRMNRKTKKRREQLRKRQNRK